VQNIELSFASSDPSLLVRSFSVELRMSGLFEIAIVATSADDDVDLDALLGSGATFRLGSTDLGASYRAFTGVVSHAEQVEIDAAGVATYFLRIVPALWRTTRRRNNRIFQHRSLPEIAIAVLAEWGIEPVIELSLPSFPRLEYRVQYAETDFAFVSRTLEEAGIAYAFRDPDQGADGAQTALVFSTDAHKGEPRANGPLTYVPGKEVKFPKDAAFHVRFIDEIRSGRLTIRDYDFRSRPDFQLIAEARAGLPLEERFELYDYAPGAFLIEPDGGRAARTDEKHAKALAARHLAATRQGKRAIAFKTNVLDLAPGQVFSLLGHPRRELGPNARLLAVKQTIEGAADGQWTVTGHAVLADEPYRPHLVTPKPRIPGLQSALVVGPPGEEIHTDEFGRVRVQFHWDREGKRDNQSSCFLRVSQAWASRGFGLLALPRVGDEVLVAFFEGDPDQPVIVGRVHNSAASVPYPLPANKTRSAWRSESSPGGGGHNEIMFEDQKGKELVYLHAERDLEHVVKHAETRSIGASLKTTIGAEESREVASDQVITVGGNRVSRVEGTEVISVGESFSLDLGGGTGATVTKDKKIVLTTGEASIVLDGPNIFLDGQAAVRLSGGDVVAIAGGEVHVDGKPNVYLNAEGAGAPGVASLSPAEEVEASTQEDEEPEVKAFSKMLSSPVEEPGAAPEALKVPAHIEQQLEALRNKAMAKAEELVEAVKDKVELAKDKLKKVGENIVPLVEKARAEAYMRIEQLRGFVEKVKAEAAAKILEIEAQAKQIWSQVQGKIDAVKAQVQAKIDQAKAMVDRAKQAYESVKARIDEAKQRVRQLVTDIKTRITDLKNEAKAKFDELRKKAIEVRNEAQHVIDEVKSAIEHAKVQFKQLVTDVKTTIDHAKQHVHDIVADLKNGNLSLKDRLKAAFGDAKELWSDGKADIATVKGDATSLVNDAKANVAQIKADAQKTLADAKNLPKEAIQDAKDLAADAKAKAKDTVAEVKSTVDDLKQQAKGATQDVKDAASDLKQEAQDLFNFKKAPAPPQPPGSPSNPVPFANKVQAAAQQGGTGSGLNPFAAPAQQGAAEAPKSIIVTKPGALGGESVAKAVNGTGGATFLQSPNEGQLMIMRTQASIPLSSQQLTTNVVEHQMNGMSSSDAFAAVLKEHGYAVYERPWDSAGQFIQKAVL
jgi:type VI secretion system secreted protein VgrG